jgi:hypothetical protein
MKTQKFWICRAGCIEGGRHYIRDERFPMQIPAECEECGKTIVVYGGSPTIHSCISLAGLTCEHLRPFYAEEHLLWKRYAYLNPELACPQCGKEHS